MVVLDLRDPIIFIPRHTSRNMVWPNRLVRASKRIVNVTRSLVLTIGKAFLHSEWIPCKRRGVIESIRGGVATAERVIGKNRVLVFGIGRGEGEASQLWNVSNLNRRACVVDMQVWIFHA